MSTLTFTHSLSLTTGFSFLAGTYVERKMEQFLGSPTRKKTDIDELILLEQRVNLLNGFAVFMQLIRILIPGKFLTLPFIFSQPLTEFFR